MSEEPMFLPLVSGDYLHARSLSEHGGQDGVRDMVVYQSAIAHPMNTYYYGHGDLFDIAAAYAFHIAEGQPFIDGNKRTGIAMALAFLQAHGIDTSIFDDDVLYDAMIAIAKRRLDKVGLAAVFREKLAR